MTARGRARLGSNGGGVMRSDRVWCLIGGGIRFQRLILNQSGVGAAIRFGGHVSFLIGRRLIMIDVVFGWLLVKIIGFGGSVPVVVLMLTQQPQRFSRVGRGCRWPWSGGHRRGRDRRAG